MRKEQNKAARTSNIESTILRSLYHAKEQLNLRYPSPWRPRWRSAPPRGPTWFPTYPMACRLACVLSMLGIQQSWSEHEQDGISCDKGTPLANGTLLATQLPLRILDPQSRDAGSHRSKNAVDVSSLAVGNDVLLSILRHGKRARKTKPRTRSRQQVQHKNDGRRRVRRVAGVTTSKASSHPATFVREGPRIAASCTPDMPRWHWWR